MEKPVGPVVIKGLVPVPSGDEPRSVAVFLGNPDKVFLIYVDVHVGHTLSMALSGVKAERPQTHDLLASVLLGLGAEVDRVLINDMRESTFFARLFLRMENELGRKLVEIDARPSDCLVIALKHQRPVFVARTVFDAVEDASEQLDQFLRRRQSGESGETGEDPEASEDPDDPEDEPGGKPGGR